MRSLTWGRSAAVAAVLVLLSGCAQQDVPQGEVERSIREGMADRGVQILDLRCPGGVVMELDASVTCDVQLGGIDPLGVPVDRIKVVVTSVDGEQVGFRLEPLAMSTDTDQETSTG